MIQTIDNSLCCDLLYQLVLLLTYNPHPQSSVLEFGHGNVVFISLIEVNTFSLEDVVVPPVNKLLPIPFVCILLNDLMG